VPIICQKVVNYNNIKPQELDTNVEQHGKGEKLVIPSVSLSCYILFTCYLISSSTKIFTMLVEISTRSSKPESSFSPSFLC